MRILISWLRDFVDVPVDAAALGHMLTMRGFELAALEPPPSGATPPWRTAVTDGGRDGVLDLEITANRPDCLSVIGIAREVSTAYRVPLTTATNGAASLAALGDRDGKHPDVTIAHEEPELCPRYAAAVADVTVGPSPLWLSARLEAAGVRAINNIVDVTNYVLIERGQPMHAFDLSKLAGSELHIRRAAVGERVRTLDGQDRALTREMLVIADATQPQAVAGVMGAASSEVGPSTRTILFESACFDRTSVRRTSRALGVKTEASARFERGTDVGAPVLALARACRLLEQIGAGRVRGPSIDSYPAPHRPAEVRLRRERIAALLGQAIEDEEVARILISLGFAPAPSADGWVVTVPTARVDVSREADLIEEVARHYGYDRLPTTFPALVQPPPPADARIERDRLVRHVLTAAGFSEAITFAFIEASAAVAFGTGSAPVPIAYPLSEKFAVLRPSLMPGLVEALAHNRRRERQDVRLFEIGSRFSAEGGESRGVGFAWIGAGAPRHWSGHQRDVDFFDVKGIAERLCAVLGMKVDVRPLRESFVVRGRAARLQVSGTVVGWLGQLTPEVALSAGLAAGDEVYGAELNLDALAVSDTTRVSPLPRFPSIVRDLSMVVDDALPAAVVRDTIQAAGPETLEHVGEFDRYQGPGVPEGRVSLSFRLTFRSADRTLTDQEVQRAIDTIVAELVREHHAIQR